MSHLSQYQCSKRYTGVVQSKLITQRMNGWASTLECVSVSVPVIKCKCLIISPLQVTALRFRDNSQQSVWEAILGVVNGGQRWHQQSLFLSWCTSSFTLMIFFFFFFFFFFLHELRNTCYMMLGNCQWQKCNTFHDFSCICVARTVFSG